MKSKKAPISPAVQAANTLTERWCSRLGDGDGEDYALSGAGLWPLLALLASAADDPAAAELAAAVGRPAGGGNRKPWRSSTSFAAASRPAPRWASGPANMFPWMNIGHPRCPMA